MPLETITHDSPIDALVTLIRALISYEQRYEMSSTEFFARYQEGKLGDSGDFVEWAGDYQHYLGLVQELRQQLKAAG